MVGKIEAHVPFLREEQNLHLDQDEESCSANICWYTLQIGCLPEAEICNI